MKKIIDYFPFILSIFFLLIAVIASTFNYKNDNFFELNYYSQFLIISLIFFIISFIFIFLKKKFKVYFFIIFNSFILSIYLFESYLFLNYNYKIGLNIQREYEKKNKKKYDTRSKIQIYNEIKQKGLTHNTTLQVYPSSFLNDKNNKLLPLSGISKKKTISCNELGYYNNYKSDRFGFNNKDDLWDVEIDYLILGDSFVQGDCVNNEHNISNNISKKMNKKILNLGVSSTGPLFQYAIFKEYAYDLKFKKLIWVFYENNDLENLYSEINNSILKSYLNKNNFSQNLKNNVTEIDNMFKSKLINEYQNKKGKNKFSLYNFLKLKLSRKVLNFKTKKMNNINNLYNSDNPQVAFNEVNFKNYFLILKKINNLLKNKNAQLLFVYVPENKRYKEMSESYTSQSEFNRKKILDFVSTENIEFVDIYEKFSNINDPLKYYPFRIKTHFTEEGYELVSSFIMEKL